MVTVAGGGGLGDEVVADHLGAPGCPGDCRKGAASGRASSSWDAGEDQRMVDTMEWPSVMVLG